MCFEELTFRSTHLGWVHCKQRVWLCGQEEYGITELCTGSHRGANVILGISPIWIWNPTNCNGVESIRNCEQAKGTFAASWSLSCQPAKWKLAGGPWRCMIPCSPSHHSGGDILIWSVREGAAVTLSVPWKGRRPVPDSGDFQPRWLLQLQITQGVLETPIDHVAFPSHSGVLSSFYSHWKQQESS